MLRVHAKHENAQKLPMNKTFGFCSSVLIYVIATDPRHCLVASETKKLWSKLNPPFADFVKSSLPFFLILLKHLKYVQHMTLQ